MVTTEMGNGPIDVKLRLPDWQCEQCILQWTYTAGNLSCTFCVSTLFNGYQEIAGANAQEGVEPWVVVHKKLSGLVPILQLPDKASYSLLYHL